MDWPIIEKSGDFAVPPYLTDWEAARAAFDWQTEIDRLSKLPGGGLNLAVEAVDRHVAEGRGETVAMRWISRNQDSRRELTYAQLKEQTDRFAAALRHLGLKRGDTVAVMLNNLAELPIAALGTIKAGCVFCPLFAAFGPEPVRARLILGRARLLVTTEALYLRKIADLREDLTELDHVLLIGGSGQPPQGCLDFQATLNAASPEDGTVEATSPDDPAMLHFTSGTTGEPKGALHPQRSAAGIHATARMVLDLRPGDIFWCTADTGWVTGSIYKLLAPLLAGATGILYEGEFDPGAWYGVLRNEKVTVWYTTPTAVRMLMRFGAALPRTYRPLSLRLAFSVGEPLNPEAVIWARDALGLPFHDTWWQTETGCIALANFAVTTIKPGSMGRPVPGFEVALVERRPEGGLRFIEDAGIPGEIALKAGWPSMFSDYIGAHTRYEECFIDGWYLTGDLAKRDADGYFWFLGRADDVIKASGHLIGPFEVESALMDHPAVAEAGVIGKPDPVAHERVKAYVSLSHGFAAGEALRRELIAFARLRLGSALAPKELVFIDELPKTRSGKIMRRVLKARELGLPTGDLSGMDSDIRGTGV
ncbi:acetate--CoA ligase [Telmatospirillum sp. J64-1]|uniref:acetate--CoA ligase n=1 Tax=Telmatospirillum sp. J64-1 TaxID=2502183 RepID=UPI00115DA189|nr:acetate--CoA ligase [Telmatospirillum sp. J64-1]